VGLTIGDALWYYQVAMENPRSQWSFMAGKIMEVNGGCYINMFDCWRLYMGVQFQ